MTSNRLHTLLFTAAMSLSSCVANVEIEVRPGEKQVDNDEVGVTVVVPESYRIADDPVLFDTHGFTILAEENDDAAVARVALAYKARPEQLEELVAAKLEQYKDVQPTRLDVTLSDGRRAVAITGLPGTQPYSVVYTLDGDRVYEIGLWSNEAGLGDAQLDLLSRMRFRKPTSAARRAALPLAQDALYGEPPADVAPAGAAAVAERARLFELAATAEPALREAARAEHFDPPTPSGALAANGCGFTAPSDLYWQLQWDKSNTFYSGSWYSLRDQPGWSAMSGNGGSWWGTNYHVGLCYANYANQYYANDWPTQRWGNAYAAFSGTVEWAGWGTDGFATLGRYVVVRNGSYRSLTAHLTAIRAGVAWGAHVDAYSEIIGWAGSTGGPWAPHLHARVSWGESLTANGQPYGGQAVRPNALRCFECNDPDVAAARGGYYTQFWHGRWMKY